MALCSLSTGRMATLCFAASRVTSSPAMTRISLLATAMSLPARIAASAGARPAVPTMEMSTMSASGIVASLIRPSGPPWQAVPEGSWPRMASSSAGVVKGHGARLEFGGLGQQRLRGAARGEADDLHAFGNIAGDFQRAFADGAGRAENHNTFFGTHGMEEQGRWRVNWPLWFRLFRRQKIISAGGFVPREPQASLPVEKDHALRARFARREIGKVDPLRRTATADVVVQDGRSSVAARRPRHPIRIRRDKGRTRILDARRLGIAHVLERHIAR